MRGQPSPNGCGLRNIMRHNGIHRTGARFAARMLAPAIVAGLLAPLAGGAIGKLRTRENLGRWLCLRGG